MQIVLHKTERRIILSAPWREDMAGLARQTAGATWSKVNKTWSYPLTMATLRSLRASFGDDLAPDAEVIAWASAQRSQERALKRLSVRDDARLRVVPSLSPTLAVAMGERTYQRVGARFGAVAGSFLLADEPGLGKTATALGAIMESGDWDGDHLVIAPKVSLDSVWRRQIGMWMPFAQAVAVPEGKARRERALKEFWELDTPRFLVINPAMVRRKYGHYCRRCDHWQEAKTRAPKKHWMEDHKYKRAVMSEDWPDILNHDWGTVILDESHELLAGYKPANITQQTAGLLDLRSEHRFALTGTPLRGHETKLWGTLDWLGHKTGGYWQWADQYFEISSNGFGKEIHGLDPSRAKSFYMTLDRFVLRRTRSEVRPDLPSGQRQTVVLEMSESHKKQYDEFAAMGETELESGIMESLGTLSELTRLKQMAYGTWRSDGGRLVPAGESEKRDWIIQWLRERGVTGDKTSWLPEAGEGYKYVIASQSTAVIDALENDLNDKHIATLKITGDVSGKRRTDAQNQFQSTDTGVRVLLIQTVTGGVSIELDAWCDEMVVLDQTWIADDQTQLEGRINNRSGRVAPRTWWYLVMAETIEETIAEGNWMQNDLQHRLLDKRRGVEFALHLIRGGR